MRRAFIWSILALPHIVLFWPVLFEGKMFADGDAVLQMYPAAYALKSALEQGQSFAWNQHIATGFPMAASFVGGFFSPLYQLLFRHFDVFNAYHVLTILNFVITAWFTYYFCKLSKLSTSASLFAGITFPLGTAYWLFSSNLTVTSGFPLIPGLLVAVLLLQRFAETYIRITISIVTGGLLGLILLQAHPQWPIMAMMFASAFAIVIDIQNRRNEQTKQSLLTMTGRFLKSFKILYWLCFTFLIGILISLPQLLASAHIGTFSARGSGIPLSRATVGSLFPTDIFSFIFPNLNLPFLMSKPYLLYMGAFPVLLFVLSHTLAKPKQYRLFFWTLFACLAIGIKHSPLFWLLHQLPIVNAFREPSRFMYIGLFAFTMLAAFGFEQLTIPVSSPSQEDNAKMDNLKRIVKWLVRSCFGLASLAILSTITIVVWGNQFLRFITSYFDRNVYATTTRLPLEHYHNVIKTLFNQIVDGTTLFNLPTAIGVLSFPAGSLLVSWYIKGSSKQPSSPTLIGNPKTNLPRFLSFDFLLSGSNLKTRDNSRRIVFSIGVITVTLINLLGVKIGALHTVPRHLIETPPASAQIIQEHNDQSPFRVFSFLPGASIYRELDATFGYDSETNIEMMKEVLSPNLNILYGISSLDYYDDLMDRRNARLLSYLGSNRGTLGESLADMHIPFEEKKKRFLDRIPLLSLANVKYITSLYPLEHSRLKLVSELRVTPYQLREYIYENLDVIPRYYLTNNVEYLPILSETESWQNLLNRKLGIADNERVLIECASCALPPRHEDGVERWLRALIPTNQTTTAYVFQIETDSDGWFIFGQNNLPGWTALIDGKPTEIHRANVLFQAIHVPAGKHVVEWKYQLSK